MKTTYSISYIPIFDKPESVPTDFSAFANFNIAKHSFWEKTAGEIQVFLNTGSFPEPARAPQPPMPTDADVPAYTKPVYAEVPAAQPAANYTLSQTEAGFAPSVPSFEQPAYQPTYQPPVTPVYQPPVVPAFEAPVTTAPVTPDVAAVPNAPTTPSAPAQPNNQPVGSEFGRAPRSFGGITF
jgi:hypothetical protein